MLLPIECACGLNQWVIVKDIPFDGKIYTHCCITTLYVSLETVKFSVQHIFEYMKSIFFQLYTAQHNADKLA